MADGFSATLLRRNIVEFASPSFDQPPASPIPFIPRADVIPNPALAKKETSSYWARRDGEVTDVSVTEQVDRLINFVPNSPGAKW